MSRAWKKHYVNSHSHQQNSHTGTFRRTSPHSYRESPSCIIVGLHCPFPDDFMEKSISPISFQCTREVMHFVVFPRENIIDS